MKRILAGLALALFVASPVAAVKPVTPEATLSIDDPTPAWGQLVTLTADANVTGTYIYMECDHAGGTSYSYSVIDYTAEPYSDDVGLYAPNWPDGAGAECTAVVRRIEVRGHHHNTTTIDGSGLTFTVSPT